MFLFYSIYLCIDYIIWISVFSQVRHCLYSLNVLTIRRYIVGDMRGGEGGDSLDDLPSFRKKPGVPPAPTTKLSYKGFVSTNHMYLTELSHKDFVRRRHMSHRTLMYAYMHFVRRRHMSHRTLMYAYMQASDTDTPLGGKWCDLCKMFVEGNKDSLKLHTET